jgi:hypothetical protein
MQFILQDWEYQEWFTKYLTPFVNFIPIAQVMNNSKEKNCSGFWNFLKK